MYMCRTLMICLALFLAPFPSWAQGRVLDLTIPPPPSPAPENLLPEGWTVTPVVTADFLGSGIRHERAPLRLRVSLDRDSYSPGDRFLARLVITNIGKENVTLPWSPFEDQVVRVPDDRLYRMSLGLNVSAPEGPDRLPLQLRFRSLYGATWDFGSVNVLRPGDSAEIIMPGHFEGVPAEVLARLGTGKDVTVRARLQFPYVDEDGRHYLPLESEPGPVVTFQPSPGHRP